MRVCIADAASVHHINGINRTGIVLFNVQHQRMECMQTSLSRTQLSTFCLFRCARMACARVFVCRMTLNLKQLITTETDESVARRERIRRNESVSHKSAIEKQKKNKNELNTPNNEQ